MHKVLLGKSVLFWVILLAIILVCLAIAVVVVVLVRRRRKRRAAGGLGAASTPEPALDLRAIRREFEARLPYDHRRALPLFTPIVVLGDAGAGKSSLIDRFTDWRGQEAQFHPSYTDDPQLQIYQGLGSVVYELAPVLLRDPSRRVRDALLKLWRPLKRGKPPRAVIVLNATTLAAMSPDDLVKHAQAIRGKLNVLTTAAGRPVPAVIALTHLDQLTGYLELAAVLREQGRALSVDFADGNIPPAASWLEPIEGYLPAVLASRPAPEYLKAAGFITAASDVLGRVETFARSLTVPDPLVPAPQATGVVLTSAREPAGGPLNPFAVTITPQDTRSFHPQRVHLAVATGAAALLIGWFVAGYVHGHNAIARAHKKVDAYLETPQNPFARKELFDHLKSERTSLVHRLTPGFFASDKEFVDASVRRHFVTGLRQQVLLPKLTEYERGRQGQPALYLMSLLYASKDNPAGKHILAHSSEWEDALRLQRQVITDYVTYNGALARIPLPFDDRGFGERFNVAVGTDLPSAPYLMDQLEKVPRMGVLTKERLATLKERADALRGDVLGVQRTGRITTVCKLLNRETGMNYGANWLGQVPRLPEVDHAAVTDVASLLKATDLQTPDPQRQTLLALVGQLEQLASQKPGPARELRLRAGDRVVTLSTTEWDRLVVRSRATLLLQEFAAAKQGDFRATFFPKELHYESVDLGAGGDGGGVVVTRAKVDGVFTEKAYSDRVKPALEKLPAVLKALPIADDAKAAFTEFVTAGAEDYATRYQGAWRALYKGYGYHAESPSALTYLLIQLQSPTSQLRRMLSEMARHTALPLVDGNPLFDPFGPIASTFGFLKAIAPKPGGPMPALDKYVALIGQLQGELEGQGTPPEGEGLASKLPPLGRVALAIFQEKSDSYYAQTEKWMASLNLRADEREPFIGPINRAFQLGIRDVERAVTESWGTLRQGHIAPLATLYPFKAEADTTATTAQIEAALKPKGEFWTAFEAQIGPVCVKQHEGWDKRRSRHRTITLPADLLPTVRRFGQLSERLFDAKGAPKALTVAMRPQLLPPQKASHHVHVVVVGYLQVGDASVFGFNQRPDWAEVKLEWWKPTTASVGAAFAAEGVGERIYRNVSVPENEWSLFRLLQRAKEVDARDHTYRWVIAAPGDGSPVQVGFQLKTDPLQSLRVSP